MSHRQNTVSFKVTHGSRNTCPTVDPDGTPSPDAHYRRGIRAPWPPLPNSKYATDYNEDHGFVKRSEVACALSRTVFELFAVLLTVGFSTLCPPNLGFCPSNTPKWSSINNTPKAHHCMRTRVLDHYALRFFARRATCAFSEALNAAP